MTNPAMPNLPGFGAIAESMEIGMFRARITLRGRQAMRRIPFAGLRAMRQRKQVVLARTRELTGLHFEHTGIGVQAWILRIRRNRRLGYCGGIVLAAAIVEQLDRADREIDVVTAAFKTCTHHCRRRVHAAGVLEDFRECERGSRVARILRQHFAQQGFRLVVAPCVPIDASQSTAYFGRLRMFLQ